MDRPSLLILSRSEAQPKLVFSQEANKHRLEDRQWWQLNNDFYVYTPYITPYAVQKIQQNYWKRMC